LSGGVSPGAADYVRKDFLRDVHGRHPLKILRSEDAQTGASPRNQNALGRLHKSDAAITRLTTTIPLTIRLDLD
jgi:hypothetical protein